MELIDKLKRIYDTTDILTKKYDISDEKIETFRHHTVILLVDAASKRVGGIKVNTPRGFPMNPDFYRALFPGVTVWQDEHYYIHLSGWGDRI